MEQKTLYDLMDLLAKAQQELVEGKSRLADLQSAPQRIEEDIARLDKEYQPLVRRLERLTAEQEGEYDTLQQQMQTLEQEKSGISVFRFKDRSAVSSQLRLCRSRCREIEQYRKEHERFCYLDGEMQKMRSAIDSAHQEAQTLEELIGRLESECTQQTLTCIEAITAMEEEDIRALVANAPETWATLPMNLLYLLCQPEKAPLRRYLTVNQKVLLCARDHIPFTMGKYRWQVVRLRADRALLICMDPVYRKCAFRRSGGDSTWANSDVRARLNADFLLDFTAQERAAILPSEETGDMVFCLSEKESRDYLSCSQRTFELKWWLRDTLPLDERFETSNFVYYVGLDGDRRVEYCSSDSFYFSNLSREYDFSLCCRPAMWVALTPETDNVIWEQLWSTAEDGIVSLWGKWHSPESKWTLDYGFTDPHSINRVRMAPKPKDTRPDYIDYDPLFGNDYHTDV